MRTYERLLKTLISNRTAIAPLKNGYMVCGLASKPVLDEIRRVKRKTNYRPLVYLLDDSFAPLGEIKEYVDKMPSSFYNLYMETRYQGVVFSVPVENIEKNLTDNQNSTGFTLARTEFEKKLIADLIKSGVSVPLAASSANLSGDESANFWEADQIHSEISSRVDCVHDSGPMYNQNGKIQPNYPLITFPEDTNENIRIATRGNSETVSTLLPIVKSLNLKYEVT